MSRDRGQIKKWFERGYGFADIDGSQANSGVFIHIRDFRGYTRGNPATPRVGDRVEMSITQDDKGLRGRDVQIL
jgi:cold shock CspA family protein